MYINTSSGALRWPYLFGSKVREELKIQNAVTGYATKIGVPWIRLAMRYGVTVGWPDVIFLFKGGRTVFIEFKDPGQELKASQKVKIDILEKQGFVVHVVDSVAQGRIILDAHKAMSDAFTAYEESNEN